MTTIRHRGVTRAAATIAATLTAIGAVLAMPADTGVHAAPANTIEVFNTADDGTPTSLRAAISTASDGDDWTIELQPAGIYVIDRLCRHGDLDDNHGGDLDLITDGEIWIRTAGPDSGVLATVVVECVGERILDHLGEGVLVIDGVRLTGGNTAKGANGVQNGDRDGQSSAPGGAIRSDGTVGLLDALLDGNRTGDGGNGAPPLFVPADGGDGGHAGVGGAVRADTIWSLQSLVTGNTTGSGGNGGNGVGPNNDGGSGGSGGNGTLAAYAVDLTRTQVEGNHLGGGGNGGAGLGAAGDGGAGGQGGRGGGVVTTDIQLTASTVAFNLAGDGGEGGSGDAAPGGFGGPGGSGGRGGGVWAETGSIARSTIHGNAAGEGSSGGGGAAPGLPGIAGFGGGLRIVPGPGVAVVFSTITANSAAGGANIDAPAATTLLATVVGEAQGGASCLAGVTNLDYTVHDEESCGAGDFVFPNLGLGPLADNGGPTKTRLPDLDGPLANFIPEEPCQDLNPSGLDQRDELRPSGNCSPGGVELPASFASMFTPLTPTRVFDTREPGAASGYVNGGSTRTVQFTGVAGIPTDGVTAVALNLTIDAAGGPGFVTAYSADGVQPLASSLNTVRAGQTVPNFVIVPVGPSGAVKFFAQTGGHLLADAVGYFTESAWATAGRTISLAPARLFDTREPGPAAGKVAAGGTLTVDVTGIAGVPGTGVSAVVVNVTATEADAAGYVTVSPGGEPLPLASTLNLDGPGHTAANLTIVPVGIDGTITLFSQSGAHLLADVTGYVTDASAPPASQGLFVPRGPFRVFDTRDDAPPIGAGGTIDIVTAGAAWIPTYAEAVILNITATEAAGAGYVTGFPTGVARPLASSLNLTFAGETRANASLLPIGGLGSISYFSQTGTHLLADWFGYLLPAPPQLAY